MHRKPRNIPILLHQSYNEYHIVLNHIMYKSASAEWHHNIPMYRMYGSNMFSMYHMGVTM